MTDDRTAHPWPKGDRTTFISVLRERKDEIRVIVSIVSLLLVAGGFGVTWMQANRATKEIQAANVYQVQKDARQLRSEVFTSSYRNIINMPDKTTQFVLREEDKSASNVVVFGKKHQEKTWKLFNFYIAVYRQAQYGMLPDEFVKDYSRDFCLLWTKKPVRMFWNSIEKEYQKSDLNETGTEDNGGLDYAKIPKDWCDST